MTTKLLLSIAGLALCFFALTMLPSKAFANKKNNESDQAKILELVELYRQSIVDANNPVLAEKIWSLTPDVSFIHPRGHEFGWNNIRENLYINTMGRIFSKRELQLTNEPLIHIYGDSAVVEFNWEFFATTKADGSQRHTQGRESQVFIKFPELGWRLVHVHYSSPPAPAK